MKPESDRPRFWAVSDPVLSGVHPLEIKMEREMGELQKAVVRAGKAVVELAKNGFGTELKNNRDPVTTADTEANRILKELLLDGFAEYGWLSEETSDDLVRLEKNRVWIVDPIDGTKEFITGIPEFAVSVALVEKGVPVLAALFNPATEEFFSAIRGQGAWLNGEPIHCKQATAGRLRVLASRTEVSKGLFQPFEPYIEVKSVGSVAYKLALIAAGRADATFSLEPKNEWDIAAGVLLVEEAGGRVTDNKGTCFVFNQAQTLVSGIIGASAGAYDRVQELRTASPGGAKSIAQSAESRGQSAWSKAQSAKGITMGAERPKFRFMDLEIWQDSMEIAGKLLDLADRLERRRLYRFAEQLRGSGLSVSNNIAEGSGSNSRREFSNFLNIARRSTFENANVILVLEKRRLVQETEATEMLQQLDHLCRKITNFQKTLRV